MHCISTLYDEGILLPLFDLAQASRLVQVVNISAGDGEGGTVLGKHDGGGRPYSGAGPGNQSNFALEFRHDTHCSCRRQGGAVITKQLD